MPDPRASDALTELPALTDLPAWSQSAAEAPAVEARPGSPAPITRDFGRSAGQRAPEWAFASSIAGSTPITRWSARWPAR